MKLTQQETADLKKLVEHQGFKVVEALVNELELTTLRGIKEVNLWDTNELAIVNATQNYLKGVEGLFNLIEGKAKTVTESMSSNEMWYINKFYQDNI